MPVGCRSTAWLSAGVPMNSDKQHRRRVVSCLSASGICILAGLRSIGTSYVGVILDSEHFRLPMAVFNPSVPVVGKPVGWRRMAPFNVGANVPHVTQDCPKAFLLRLAITSKISASPKWAAR